MKSLKNILFVFVVLFSVVLFFPSLWYAQKCSQYDAIIKWPTDIKEKLDVNYQTILFDIEEQKELVMENIKDNLSVNYRIFKDGKAVFNQVTEELKYWFPNIGIYEVSSTVSLWGCNYSDTITVRSYSNVFFYFGQFLKDFNQWLQQNIQQNDILFSSFIVDANVDDIMKPSLLLDIEKKITDVEQSQIFFFNLASFSSVFSLVDWFQNSKAVSFNEKKVVLISDIDPDLLKKFLAPFFKGHAFELYLMDLETLRGDIFYNLSVWNTDFVNSYFTNPVVFWGEGWSYSLSRIVDLLIYYWFSMKLVALLLVISFCVLLLVFFRQIIWVSVYWLYFPILMAVIFSSIGEPLALVFFAIAYISHLASMLLQKYINMLVYAKIWSYVLIYILFSLIFIGLFTLLFAYQWNFGWVDELSVLISFIVMPMAGKKVFWSKANNLSFKQILNIIWFLLLSYWLTNMLESIELQNWLLVKPELLFILLIWVIVVWKFTWLQAVEYIRFWPLIKKEIREWKKNVYKRKS